MSCSLGLFRKWRYVQIIACFLGLIAYRNDKTAPRPQLQSHLEVMIYLTAIGLPPGGSSAVNIYTQTIRRTTQSTQTIHRKTQFTNQEECGQCPVYASYTLAFALQLRKKHGKTSVRVVGECQLARRKQNIQNRAYKQ